MDNIKVLDFSSFLNESGFLNEAERRGKREKIKVVLLTGNAESNKTGDSFVKECKKMGFQCYVIDVNESILTIGKEEKDFIEYGDKKFEISTHDTVFIPRRGVISNSYTKKIMLQLQKGGYFTLNSLESMDICENKYVTAQVMEEYNLPVPRYSLVQDENYLDKALVEVGGKFPIIMKLLSGTQGIGVSIVDSYASYKSVYQTIRKLNSSSEILVQEKIDSNFDLRIQVIVKNLGEVNYKENPENFIVLGAMKRKAIKKDFRTNYSLGGEVEKYNLPEKLKEIACNAAAAVGCHWCGVDLMIDSKTKKPYILEVNSSPGTEGISKALGVPIVSEVLKYVSDKNNWILPEYSIGYLESVRIPGIGEMVAKFDTGNGSSACSMHVDKIEVKNGKIHWEIKGRKFSNPIVHESKTRTGKVVDERPIMELDIEFNGRIYDKVRVSPVDRTEFSAPFLVNRIFMKRIGVKIDPDREFLVTQDINGFEKNRTKLGYGKAKGDPYSGIKFE
jgi:ribosomal protein S6--L-glutamate ligase